MSWKDALYFAGVFESSFSLDIMVFGIHGKMPGPRCSANLPLGVYPSRMDVTQIIVSSFSEVQGSQWFAYCFTCHNWFMGKGYAQSIAMYFWQTFGAFDFSGFFSHMTGTEHGVR